MIRLILEIFGLDHEIFNPRETLKDTIGLLGLCALLVAAPFYVLVMQ